MSWYDEGIFPAFRKKYQKKKSNWIISHNSYICTLKKESSFAEATEDKGRDSSDVPENSNL
jgi:hypothetical protein